MELKSVEQLAPVHAKQVLTYLKLLDLPLGLLINFGAPTLKEGCKRIVNGPQDFVTSSLRVNQKKKTSIFSIHGNSSFGGLIFINNCK